jgi:23S rRNA (pseudouridine1915-N3)-methyltransferase
VRNIKIICVGKIKQQAKYLEAGIALYTERLSHQFKIEWVEVAEASKENGLSVEQIKNKEAALISRQIEAGCPLLILSEGGRLMNSEDFSAWFFGGNPLLGGPPLPPWNRIIIIVGGAYGLAKPLLTQTPFVLSLSRMTFPHQMVRLILIEQLYRALSLYQNDPYHK